MNRAKTWNSRLLWLSTLVLMPMLVGRPLLHAQAPSRGPGREVENVAALARLYGVVRFFYPTDAAAGVEWDRLAVEAGAISRAGAVG